MPTLLKTLFLTDVNDFRNYGCRVPAVIRYSLIVEALLEKLQAFGVLEVFIFIHFSDRFIKPSSDSIRIRIRKCDKKNCKNH